MKTCLTTLCALLLAVAVSQAAEPLRVKLFPEGTPTKSGLEEQPEGVNDKGYYIRVSDPELLVYLPDPARATGQAMLVVPGGSYEKVCITHEGYKTAEWLNEHGIAAMILKYRMPNGHPGIPLEDGEQAMRVIRRNAAQWNIDRNYRILGGRPLRLDTHHGIHERGDAPRLRRPGLPGRLDEVFQRPDPGEPSRGPQRRGGIAQTPLDLRAGARRSARDNAPAVQ